MKIYLIQPVRRLTPAIQIDIENYIYIKEEEGHQVYAPHRDTKQDGTALEICRANRQAIQDADEVHIFWDNESLGSHFDLGIAFAYDKKIVIIDELYPNTEYNSGFGKLIVQITQEK